jgi:hypothetical protein
MEVTVPELTPVPTVLTSTRSADRGRAASPPELRDRLSLGEPLALPLTPDRTGEDAALRAFVEAEAATSGYWLVHLACTFTPADDERLERAWLTVSLERDDGAQAPGPIAWSMAPMRLERPLQRGRTLKIGANAAFASAGVETGTTTTGAAVYLAALNLQEPTPTWEFTRTAADEIRGATQLALVVRAPRAAPVSGTVELTAALRTRRFGLLPMRAETLARPAIGFRLAAAAVT